MPRSDRWSVFDQHLSNIISTYIDEARRDLDPVTNVDGEALMERRVETSDHVYHSLKYMHDFLNEPEEVDDDQDELLECGECGQEYTRADSPRVHAGMKCGQCAYGM